MKRLSMIPAAIFAGCSITITPLGEHKTPAKYQTRKHSHTNRNQSSQSDSNILVDPEWLTQYRKMECDHGNYTIPDDNKIESIQNGKIRVPRSVIKHFNDLNRVPTPTPTPVPGVSMLEYLEGVT